MTNVAPLLDTEALRSYLRTTWVRECGQRVRARRKLFDWSLVKLSGLTGIPYQTIHKIEVGEIVAGDHLRLALAQALGCEVADLFPLPTKQRVAELAAEWAA